MPEARPEPQEEWDAHEELPPTEGVSVRHDPETYRRLAVPFKNAGMAASYLKAFFEVVQAARKDFYIRDVVVIAEVTYATTMGRHTQHVGEPLPEGAAADKPLLCTAFAHVAFGDSFCHARMLETCLASATIVKPAANRSAGANPEPVGGDPFNAVSPAPGAPIGTTPPG